MPVLQSSHLFKPARSWSLPTWFSSLPATSPRLASALKTSLGDQTGQHCSWKVRWSRRLSGPATRPLQSFAPWSQLWAFREPIFASWTSLANQSTTPRATTSGRQSNCPFALIPPQTRPVSLWLRQTTSPCFFPRLPLIAVIRWSRPFVPAWSWTRLVAPWSLQRACPALASAFETGHSCSTPQLSWPPRLQLQSPVAPLHASLSRARLTLGIRVLLMPIFVCTFSFHQLEIFGCGK